MRGVVAILAVVVLTGCGGRDETHLLDDALPGPAVPPARFLGDDGGATGRFDGWIASFGDARLTALVDEAIAANRDLAAAAQRVRQAALAARQAGAALAPEVDAVVTSTSTGRLDGTGREATTVDAGLRLSWEIDVWGRVAAARSAEAARAESAAEDFAYARMSLAAQVAQAYLVAVQARQQEAIAAEFTRIQDETVRLTELRRAAGRSGDYQLSLARAQAATAADGLARAQLAHRQATRAIELLIGHYPADGVVEADTLPAMPPSPPPGLPSALLERRPDLRAAQRRVVAAFQSGRSARAARLPQLSLVDEAGVVAPGFRHLSADDAFWSVIGNLIAPVFDAGRRGLQVRIEDTRQREAVLQYGQIALTAFRDVEDALDREQALARRGELVALARREQEQAMRLANLRFTAGAIDQVELLTVQARALDARTAELAVETDRRRTRVDLHLALGGAFAASPSQPLTP